MRIGRTMRASEDSSPVQTRLCWGFGYTVNWPIVGLDLPISYKHPTNTVKKLLFSLCTSRTKILPLKRFCPWNVISDVDRGSPAFLLFLNLLYTRYVVAHEYSQLLASFRFIIETLLECHLLFVPVLCIQVLSLLILSSWKSGSYN